MASRGSSLRKCMSSSSFQGRKKASETGGGGPDGSRRSLSSSRSMGLTGERTVKRLGLSKALTVPENTSIYQACCRMAAHRVDALLITDSNSLLCGILTDKDLVSRVIARELNLEETPVSKVMTRSPVFVLSETLALEALQKMVQGKFRHLPVVDNGEVIAILDIAKCLYDAITRMERAAEKGKAIAAAVEGVEKNWGTSISAANMFIETLREQMFRPAISTIIPENSKIVTVSPTETVLEVTKKMFESASSCAVVTVDKKARGIFTSKDILMRVITQNLSPNSTLVEKVMTPNPECATIDTTIVDALHTMHDGKFLHLPVLDRDENIVAVLDVIHIAHAAVATVGSAAAANNETANTMMQKFWDSTMALGPNDDDDEARSEGSLKLASEGTEAGRSFLYPSSAYRNAFSFKIEDKRGRMHRFNCETRNLTDIRTSILQRLGDGINRNNLPQILYEDEDHDKVVLASDGDLITAVEHARSAGLKECATIDTPIVDALHTMHDGKFLHLPVLDRDENIVAVLDVIHIAHAAVATVGSAAAANNETANTMMQKFWDSTMALGPNDDDDEARSEGSLKLASEGTEAGRSFLYPSSAYRNVFSFKIEDKRGRMHRFNCETRNLTDIRTSILQRLGDGINRNNLPQILYEDEDHDKVVLASDGDLITAVEHARSAGLKSLRLHLEYSGRKGSGSEGFVNAEANARASAYSTIAAGAALVAGLGVLAYMKRSGF